MEKQSAVAALLRECERALDTLPAAKAGTGEAEQRECRRCQALLPEELRSLLEEAKEMKWPFVPEKWQYKQDLGPEDKTNLQDMISARLPDLLAYLKASILARDCSTATAVVFLIDRFLYWIDASSRLLRIAKGLHRLHPGAPISPQLLIRQARLALNAGKLLKAEYILSSLINDNGATGTWRYAEESDRILVQAVCLQIRGQILQKLGMWYEAAELIWASVVGYFKLPQPDKKGIATSLGIMADIFASMNEQDYARFKTNPDIDLVRLGLGLECVDSSGGLKFTHTFPLLCCQYTPLFVLTAVNIRGTCLLSYSHSKDCPPEKREFYLSEAKESFEIGLLTKEEQSAITSKQELHSFIKAAFCLATVHRWLHGESQELHEVTQLCREALGKLHSYSTLLPEEEGKGLLAKEIMSLIASVKKRLRVGSFPNSDARSYVPDSYKNSVQKPVLQGETSFEKILAKHSQHHLSVCQVFEKTCRIHKTTPGEIQVGACITTLRTETKTMDTVCTSEDTVHQRRGVVKILNLPTAGNSSEALSGQRNQDIGSGAMKISFEEEIEPLKIKITSENGVFSRGQNRSQSTTSENSWCKLSKSSYSSSWEELNCNGSRESLRNGQQSEKGSVEQQCCTTESDGNGQDGSLCSLPPRAWNPAPPESLHGSGGSPQHSLEGSAPPARRMVEESLCREELREGRHRGRSSSEEKAKGSSSEFLSLSTSYSVLTGQEEEEKRFSCTELSCRTKDSSREEGIGHFKWVHSGELADSTEDPSSEAQPPLNTSVPSTNIRLKTSSDCSVRDWVRKSAVLGSRSLQVPQVDTQAETVDDTDFELISVGDVVNNYPAALAPKHEATPSVPAALPSWGNTSTTKHFDCATTEEDEEKSQDVVSSKRQSSSSLSSWIKPAQMLMSSPEGSVPRGSGFAFTPGGMKEEILDARFLRDDDYRKLLAGVEHNWLVQRLMPTGIFRTKELHKAYSALLLKYSKKSGLWTGQETAVFIGDYLNVAKEGKQRRAFWIHFLHQEETLGRYVGKEYKEEKGLLHHFSDVERQMTAQYYVTEFNKRLYEQKIPTQIFYIPSAVLLILEDRTIKGCVSVEPYILGEFVKLSNNTKVVKNEYKATEYGLAYGHFSYEFSKGTDVVVDLQGWVTGNGKGLIYLTDPQIHSLNSKDISRSNFGKKGIYYFFNDQHVECNEICSCLSLRRPSVELLA
ncbi:hypothetical protein Nmel_006597 [Mimus melanotis]